MKKLVSSPWHVVSVGLLGLVMGYALVIATHSATAYAGNVRCPMKDAQHAQNI